jgi:hypothetical protein
VDNARIISNLDQDRFRNPNIKQESLSIPGAVDKSQMMAIINKIQELSDGLSLCLEKSLREIGETQTYFADLSSDFILNYKSKNSSLPFMPLSVMTNVLNISRYNDTSNLLLPTMTGLPEYKFNRACRSILGKDNTEPNLDLLPACKELYNNYSQSSQTRNVIPISDFSTTCKTIIKLLRYLGSGLSHSRLFANMKNPIITYVNVAANVCDIRVITKQSAFNAINFVPSEHFIAAQPNAGIPDLEDVRHSIQWSDLNAGNVYGAKFGYLGVNVTSPFNCAIGGGYQLPIAADRIDLITHKQLGVMMREFTRKLWVNPREQARFVVMLRSCLSEFSRLTPLPDLSFGNLALMSKTTADVISNIESDELENEMKKVITIGNNNVRNELRIQNIIDMDVVPINVHAMMREIPFANLINYAYTFDVMTTMLLAPELLNDERSLYETLQAQLITAAPSVTSVRYTLLKLLVAPYAPLSENIIGGNIHSEYFQKVVPILKGDISRNGSANDTLKFLSDQILYKVLLYQPGTYANAEVARNYVFRRGIPLPVNNAIANAPFMAPPQTLATYGGSTAYPNAGNLARPINLSNITTITKYAKVGRGPETRMVDIVELSGRAVQSRSAANLVNHVLSPVEASDMRNAIMQIGRMRFDTKIIRNMTWLALLQRMMRKLMEDHAVRIRAPVARSLGVINPNITDGTLDTLIYDRNATSGMDYDPL